jgi:hypothetical protein
MIMMMIIMPITSPFLASCGRTNTSEDVTLYEKETDMRSSIVPF